MLVENAVKFRIELVASRKAIQTIILQVLLHFYELIKTDLFSKFVTIKISIIHLIYNKNIFTSTLDLQF